MPAAECLGFSFQVGRQSDRKVGRSLLSNVGASMIVLDTQRHALFIGARLWSRATRSFSVSLLSGPPFGPDLSCH